RPGAFREALVTGGQDRRATWSKQKIRQCGRHCAPGDKSQIGDEDENPGNLPPSTHCARWGFGLLRNLLVVDHGFPPKPERGPNAVHHLSDESSPFTNENHLICFSMCSAFTNSLSSGDGSP